VPHRPVFHFSRFHCVTSIQLSTGISPLSRKTCLCNISGMPADRITGTDYVISDTLPHRHAGTLKLLMPLFAYPTIYFIIKNMENTSRLRKPLNNTCVKKVFSMKTDLKSLSSPESVFQWKVTEHM